MKAKLVESLINHSFLKNPNKENEISEEKTGFWKINGELLIEKSQFEAANQAKLKEKLIMKDAQLEHLWCK